jgi:hypothetical protein
MKSHSLFCLAILSATFVSCRQKQTDSATLDNGTAEVDETGAPQPGKYKQGLHGECIVELSEIVATSGKLTSLVVTTAQEHPSQTCMSKSGLKIHYVGCEKGFCKKERNAQTGAVSDSYFPLTIYKGGLVQFSSTLDVGRPGDPPSLTTAHYMYKLSDLPVSNPTSVDTDARRHVKSLPGIYSGYGSSCSLEIRPVDGDRNLLFVFKANGQTKEKKYSIVQIETGYRQYKNTHDVMFNRNIMVATEQRSGFLGLGDHSSEVLDLSFNSVPDAETSKLVGGSWQKTTSNGQFAQPNVERVICWRLTKN